MVIRLMVGVLLVGLFTCLSLGAPATQPAPADAPELTELQQNQLMQLSDAEANIQAINKALVRTGYNVGQAYDQIDSSQKGNERMNRNGGGPVRWDTFYGKTARDFVMHDTDSPVYHQLKRPSQFNFIYKANNDQVERAREQIASLAKDQAMLLDRRRKHEADQCRLWAILAWQQVKDREIDLRPVCRYALKPANADAAVLRPLILFLRTANAAAVEGLDSVASDQQATFESVNQRMSAMFAALQLSLSDALDGDLKPEHKAEGQRLKAVCKQLSEECKIIASNYANAADRDQANQDTSKLEFRGHLQTSLSRFATLTGELDDGLSKAIKAWQISADRNIPTPDAVAPGVLKRTDVAEGHRPAPPISKPHSDPEGWIDLFNGVDTSGWEPAPGARDAEWRVVDGVLTGDGAHGYLTTTRSDFDDFDLRVQARISNGGNSGVLFRSTGMNPLDGAYQAQIADSSDSDPMKTGSIKFFGVPKRRTTELDLRTSPIAPHVWFVMEISVRGPHISVSLDGKRVVDLNDRNDLSRSGHISVECYHCHPIEFKKVQIRAAKSTE